MSNYQRNVLALAVKTTPLGLFFTQGYIMDNYQQGLVRNLNFELSLLYRISDVSIIFGMLVLVCLGFSQPFDLVYQSLGLFLSATFLMVAESFNLYRSWRIATLKQQSNVTLMVWLSCIFTLFVVGYFLKVSENYSRVVLGCWLVVCPAVLIGWRLLVKEGLVWLRSKGYNTRKAAIIGLTENGVRLKRDLLEDKALGIKLIGFFDDRELQRIDDLGQHGGIGKVAQVLEMAKNGQVDHVYIALPMQAKERIAYYLQQLSDTTATTFIVPDFFTYNLLQSRWYSLGNSQAVSVFDTPFHGPNMWIKRIQDIVLASCIIGLISPLLLAVALGVKFSSPGPVLFKQDRYGLDGRKIRVWKFRSMRSMDNGSVVKQATKNDPRVTPFGAFIRRTSLDELPQFFNVLLGNMSIVGPRPHAVAHNEEYRQLVERYMLRHKVKPGITGWAQINGYRGETDTLDKMEKRIAYDLEYIQSWSLLMDIKIVYLTIFKGFVSKTAY